MRNTRPFVLVAMAALLGVALAARLPAEPASLQAEKPRNKGIFEPVNYPADVTLFSVHFVDANVGWAAGGRGEMAGGVILHTTDGGDNWEIQFGDLDSSERAFKFLRFIDARHGWVQKGNQDLLRTVDGGETWEELGRQPVLSHKGIWTFVSPTVGFGAARPGIMRTDDGGGTWKPVYTCQESVEVDGLTRTANCQVEAIHFPTPQVGYALGDGPTGTWVLKTTDGGGSWTLAHVIPDTSGSGSAVFFTSEQRGIVRAGQGRIFATSDGGNTWQNIAGAKVQGRPPLQFAGGDVGWSIAYRRFVFTTDGGRRWSSRELSFPTDVNDFSLPRPDRGYVVGDGGMIYRYRVVPVEYKVTRGIDAPLMPGGPSATDGKPEGR